MPKRKNKRRRQRTERLRIPLSVEEAEKEFALQFRRALRCLEKSTNATPDTTRDVHPQQDPIIELAEAICDYITEKNVIKPSHGWQDYLLLSRLKRLILQNAAKEISRKTHDGERMAELKAIFRNLPTTVNASEEEILEIVSTLSAQKPSARDVTYHDVVIEIAKLRRVKIDVQSLKEFDILNEVRKTVDSVIKSHEQSKLILLIEGILIGLISSGLFELLKWSLVSLIRRAPTATSQIYEVECDVLRSFYEWRPAPKCTNGFEEEEVSLVHLYVLHAVCVLAVLGGSVSRNHLHWMVHADNATEQ